MLMTQTFAERSLSQQFQQTDPAPFKRVNWSAIDTREMKKIFSSSYPKLRLSFVTPFFDPEQYTCDLSIAENEMRAKKRKILMFPRKCRVEVLEVKRKLEQKYDGLEITLAENKQPAEIVELYQDVGVLILLSEAEGLCFPIVEAMFSGVIVITWPTGAPELFVNDRFSGFLAEEYADVSQILTKFDELQGMPEKELLEIRRNARRVVETLFQREKTEFEAILAYQELKGMKLAEFPG